MMGAPLSLWLFWAVTLVAVIGTGLVMIVRRLNPVRLLSQREWLTAAKIVGIFVLVLVIVYFQNAHRYDAREFIYGRF